MLRYGGKSNWSLIPIPNSAQSWWDQQKYIFFTTQIDLCGEKWNHRLCPRCKLSKILIMQGKAMSCGELRFVFLIPSFIFHSFVLAVMSSGRCRCAMRCSRTIDTVRPAGSSQTQPACLCPWDSRETDTSTLLDTTQWTCSGQKVNQTCPV